MTKDKHGRVRLRAVDVPVVDDLTIFGGAGIGARVSFDVTYDPFGKVRHLRPTSPDPTDPHSFKGDFRFAISAGTFAGSNDLGFSFIATATNDTPDFPGLVFGEMGTEGNGFFLH